MDYVKSSQDSKDNKFIFDTSRLELMPSSRYSDLSISEFYRYVCTFCLFVDQFFEYNVEFNRINRTFRLTVDKGEDDLIDDKLFSMETKNLLALEYFQLAIDEFFGLKHKTNIKKLFHKLNIEYSKEGVSKYKQIPGYVKMLDDLNWTVGRFQSAGFKNHVLTKTLEMIYGMCMSC